MCRASLGPGDWAWSSTKTGSEVPLPTQGFVLRGPRSQEGGQVLWQWARALEAEEQRGCEPAGSDAPCLSSARV